MHLDPHPLAHLDPRERDRLNQVTHACYDMARRKLGSAMASGHERGRRIAMRLMDEAVSTGQELQRMSTACKPGCDACCHLRVDATAQEIFGLIDYVAEHQGAAAMQRLHTRVDTFRAAMAGLDREARLRRNDPCPLLQDGRCSAYGARPLMCRRHHSLDAQACQAIKDSPEIDSNRPASAVVDMMALAVLGAYLDEGAAHGMERTHWDLVDGLHEALNDPKARLRHESGDPAFVHAMSAPTA